MFSQTRAFLRIACTANIFFLIAALVGAISFPERLVKAGPFVQVGVLLPVVTTLWLVLDIVTAWNRYRKVRFTFQRTTFTDVYFLRGVRLDWLKEGVEILRETVDKLRTDESLLVREREKCEELVRSGKFIEALAFAETAARRNARAARAVERQMEMPGSEANVLLARGIALGVPEPKMRAAIRESLSAARGVIGRQEFLNRLLSAAKASGVESAVQFLIEQSNEHEAERLVARAKLLIADARAHGVERDVRNHIGTGNFEAAGRIIANAKTTAAFVSERESFSARIDALPAHMRAIPRQLLEKLSMEQVGTRAFRIARHELERSLVK